MTLWKFMYTDQWGKRQMTRYHLSEEDAVKRFGPDVEKVEWSKFEPQALGSTSDFMRPKP